MMLGFALGFVVGIVATLGVLYAIILTAAAGSIRR